MTTPFTDAHARLDAHPGHRSAVVATITGSQAHIAHVGLDAAGWTALDRNTLVLARIDREEPYWAADAARELLAAGITVEIAPLVQAAMRRDWTWSEFPVPWSTWAQTRKVSEQAQTIYDDIRHGHLRIHAHAQHGHTTVAVGTYLACFGGVKSVLLHGENHLRKITGTFDSPAQALTEFERCHGAAMLIGPPEPTETERATAEARTSLSRKTGESGHAMRNPETVPAYAADAGDHNALLDQFLDTHGQWQKWRTWSDDTTHAIHEDQTLRIELAHEHPAHQTAWTVAAYETPVSDRTWALTATGTTPAPVLEGLLTHLAIIANAGAAEEGPVDEQAATTATEPLTEAGWKHTVEDGRWMRWTSPAGDAGVQFQAVTQQPGLHTWTVWAGPSLNRATWILTASPSTPGSLLADLSETLAHVTGIRQAPATGPRRKTGLGESPLSIPGLNSVPAARPTR
ncbi:DUF317 domain-containing protein [Streptomyces sp. NBC_01237]|uniref:DUF317 domain-containing protein n=1 Tax=Streptomyces sp. NBC_01237 TaxID=2903790 RepID=UPI002DDB0CEC|nr:DUF317 domain-containing protein [Streptomyces sp. NBC_01237]WRZ77660.1 DUF317 domain-containing protein [Streptomyces sp. NBC_01237]